MLKNIHVVLLWLIYAWVAFVAYSFLSIHGDGAPGLFTLFLIETTVPFVLLLSVRNYIGTKLNERKGLVVPRPNKLVNVVYVAVIVFGSSLFLYQIYITYF